MNTRRIERHVTGAVAASTVVAAGVAALLLVAAAAYAAFRLIGPAYVLAQYERALAVLCVAVAPLAVGLLVLLARRALTLGNHFTPRLRTVAVWAARAVLLLVAVWLASSVFLVSWPNNGPDALGADLEFIVRPASALLFVSCILGLYALHGIGGESAGMSDVQGSSGAVTR